MEESKQRQTRLSGLYAVLALYDTLIRKIIKSPVLKIVTKGDGTINSKIVKFPKHNNTVNNINSIHVVTDLVDSILKGNIEEAAKKRTLQSVNVISDKPFVLNHIINSINGTKSPIYIKDRDILIVKMLVSGLKNEEIINFKYIDIDKYSLKEELKADLYIFINKYFAENNQQFLFLDNTKKRVITSNIINRVINKYIKNHILGE